MWPLYQLSQNHCPVTLSDVPVVPFGQTDTRNSIHFELDKSFDIFGLIFEAQKVGGLAQDHDLDLEFVASCR